MSNCSNHECGCTTSAPISQASADSVLTLQVDKMDCPTEEALIRQRIEGMLGIFNLDFNLMQRRLSIQHRLADPAPIVAAIAALGMDPSVENDGQDNASKRAVFMIENMDCPTEEALIRNKLAAMPEIVALEFNLMQRKLTVSHRFPDAASILTALRGAAGTDTAIETADVALMDDDLRKIPHFIRLSRRAGMILTQNITLALGIKADFFVLAVMAKASLWMAVFADMGASLIVVANGLRLLKIQEAREKAAQATLSVSGRSGAH